MGEDIKIPKVWEKVNWWTIWRIYEHTNHYDLAVMKDWEHWSIRILKKDIK